MEQRPSASKTLKERQALRRKTQLMKWRKDEREKRAKLRKKERELRLEEKRLTKERKIREKELKSERMELESEKRDWAKEKKRQERSLERLGNNLARQIERRVENDFAVHNTVRFRRFDTSLLDNKVNLDFTYHFGGGFAVDLKFSGPHAKWMTVTAQGTKFMNLSFRTEGFNRSYLKLERITMDFTIVEICILRALRVPLTLPRFTLASRITMDLADDGTLTLSAPLYGPADLIGWKTVFEPGAVQDPEVLLSSPVSAAAKWILAKCRFVE